MSTHAGVAPRTRATNLSVVVALMQDFIPHLFYSHRWSESLGLRPSKPFLIHDISKPKTTLLTLPILGPPMIRDPCVGDVYADWTASST